MALPRKMSVGSSDPSLTKSARRHEVETAWDALPASPASPPASGAQEDPYLEAEPGEDVVVRSEGCQEGVSAFSMNTLGESLRVTMRMDEGLAATTTHGQLAPPPSPPTPEHAAEMMQKAIAGIPSGSGDGSLASSSGDGSASSAVASGTGRDDALVQWLREQDGHMATPPVPAGRRGSWIPYLEYQDSDGDDCEPKQRFYWSDDEPDIDKEVEDFEAMMAIPMPDEMPSVLEHAVRLGDITREEAEAAEAEVQAQLAADYYEDMLGTSEETADKEDDDEGAWQGARLGMLTADSGTTPLTTASVTSPGTSDTLLQKTAGREAVSTVVDLTGEDEAEDEDDRRPLVDLVPQEARRAKRPRVTDALRKNPAPDPPRRPYHSRGVEIMTGPVPMTLPSRSVLLKDVPVQLVQRPGLGEVPVGWARKLMKAESAHAQAAVLPPRVVGSTCAMQMWAILVREAREIALVIRALVLELLGANRPHVRFLYQVCMQKSLVVVATTRDGKCII